MKRSEERKQFLSCITTTAVEGGIGYWAAVQKYRWKDREDDVYAAIITDEGQTYLIDNDVIATGIKHILLGDEGYCKVNQRILQTVKEANRENDASNIDAEIADCIVQAGTMNEIVYA
jgi:hypothetical protein